MTDTDHTPEADDGDLARLLAAAGARAKAAPQAVADVRAAVEAEWRATVAARRRRRQYTGWAMAAGVAVAAVAVWLARPLYQVGAEPVASLTRIVGDVQVKSGDGHWSAVAGGSRIRSGDVVRTTAGGRAALALSNGVQLRLDTGTRVAFNDASGAALTRGAVYVDSGASAGGAVARFVLSTPDGDVRHLGTQYLAKVDGSSLQLAVREGRVELSGSRGPVTANAGELLSVSDGTVMRTMLAANAPEWGWVSDVTPPFSIDGRSVDEFLAWAARETGRRIVYATPEAERQARTVTLSGTVQELPPDQAVAAVLATTSLEPAVGPDQITVHQASR